MEHSVGRKRRIRIVTSLGWKQLQGHYAAPRYRGAAFSWVAYVRRKERAPARNRGLVSVVCRPGLVDDARADLVARVTTTPALVRDQAAAIFRSAKEPRENGKCNGLEWCS